MEAKNEAEAIAHLRALNERADWRHRDLEKKAEALEKENLRLKQEVELLRTLLRESGIPIADA